MPETNCYRTEAADGEAVYGMDHKPLGTLAQKVVSREGIVEYGVLRVACGHGDIFVPLPWVLVRFDPRAGCYVADVGRLKLLEAPYFKALDSFAFDDDFVAQIDAAFGMEYPGIEALNDFA